MWHAMCYCSVVVMWTKIRTYSYLRYLRSIWKYVHICHNVRLWTSKRRNFKIWTCTYIYFEWVQFNNNINHQKSEECILKSVLNRYFFAIEVFWSCRHMKRCTQINVLQAKFVFSQNSIQLLMLSFFRDRFHLTSRRCHFSKIDFIWQANATQVVHDWWGNFHLISNLQIYNHKNKIQINIYAKMIKIN